MLVDVGLIISAMNVYIKAEEKKEQGILKLKDGTLKCVQMQSESSSVKEILNHFEHALDAKAVNNITSNDLKVVARFIEILKLHSNSEDGSLISKVAEKIVLFGYLCNRLNLDDIPIQLQSDKIKAIEAVRQDGKILKGLSKDLKNDKDVVLAAVRQNGGALYVASKDLKNDKEVVLAAVTQNGWILQYASYALKNDKDVVLTAVKQDGRALKYASKELKNDKDVVLEAVRQNKEALQYASYALKNDKDVVLEAVRQDGRALKYASKELKNDKDVVLEAVRQNKEALQYVSEDLKNDKDVVLEAVRQDGWALDYASEDLKNDKEVVLAAVTQNGWILQYASYALKNDKYVVLAAVRQNGGALYAASEELKNDKEVVLAAVKQDGMALYYASKNLQNDKDVVLTAVKQHRRALAYTSEDLKNDKDVVLVAWINHEDAILYAGDKAILTISFKELFKECWADYENYSTSESINALMDFLDGQTLHLISKKQLLISVRSLMGAVSQEILEDQNCINIIKSICLLVNPEGRLILIDQFKKLSKAELAKVKADSIPELRIKLMLKGFQHLVHNESFINNINKKKWANAYYKDTKQQMVVLEFFKAIIDLYPSLNDSEKQVLEGFLEDSLFNNQLSNDQLLKRFVLLKSMLAIFGKEAFIEGCSKDIKSLEGLFALKFQKLFDFKAIGLDDSSFNISERYEKTFKQFREPQALFTYLSQVKQVEPVVYQALCQYVYHVLKGDFENFRNSEVTDQPHLERLYAMDGIREKWLKAEPIQEIAEVGRLKSIDLLEFFYQKIIIDNHLNDREEPSVLKAYLNCMRANQEVDSKSYLEKLESHIGLIEKDPSLDERILIRLKLEVLMIKLISKEISIEDLKKQREELYRNSSIKQEDVEQTLSQDFEVLYNQSLSTAKSSMIYRVQFTTDPNDLLLAGTEVQGSCQRVDGTPGLNKCLLGYLLNGESQAITIKDQTGKLVGRAILRLLLDDQNNPALFLERVYLNKQLDSWKEAIISMAIEKAKAMEVPLLSKEVGTGKAFHGALHFKGGRAPFIYSDASGGVLNGQQAFATTRTHILFTPQ